MEAPTRPAHPSVAALDSPGPGAWDPRISRPGGDEGGRTGDVAAGDGA